ncbi:MAG: hypothetical protein AB1649_07390 [Chloroflexota bacterium]
MFHAYQAVAIKVNGQTNVVVVVLVVHMVAKSVQLEAGWAAALWWLPVGRDYG